MPSIVNQANKDILACYGITLEKELKSHSVIKLKDSDNSIRINKNLYDKLLHSASNCTKQIIKLPDISFGVELEFIGSNTHYDLSGFMIGAFRLLKGDFFSSLSYCHNDGKSWILGKDNSIDTSNSNLQEPFGYELSTPKLNPFSTRDINLLSQVIDLAKTSLCAEINKSCGTHIHIGFKHNSILKGSICDLLSTYSFMEKTVFDPIVPTSRRRNKYCSTTKPWIKSKYQKLSSRFCEFSYDGECKNLHFEFRQLEGTLDLTTILNWTILQLYVLYDLIEHISEVEYIRSMMKKNIFDILFSYEFDSSLISFFINRVVEFKSRTI
jgi:hypothetical protein